MSCPMSGYPSESEVPCNRDASPPFGYSVLDAVLDDIREGIDYSERRGLISPNEKRDLRSRIRDARKEIKGVVTDLRKLTGRRS